MRPELGSLFRVEPKSATRYENSLTKSLYAKSDPSSNLIRKVSLFPHMVVARTAVA